MLNRLRRNLAAFLVVTAVFPAARALAQSSSSGATGGMSGRSADDLENVQGSPEIRNGGGNGYLLAEGMIFHPSFELSTAYQTNVFFENDQNSVNPGQSGPVGSPLMRIGVGAAITSEHRPGDADVSAGDAPKLQFTGNADLYWNQYLSGNNFVTSQDNLGIGTRLNLAVNPKGQIIFTATDGFVRSIAPPHFQTFDDISRDKNELTLGVNWRPGGGAIQAYGTYQFDVDLFERSDLQFANRMSNIVAIGSKWQFFPKTQFSGEVSMGYVDPYGTGTFKSSSLPLRITVGTSTLITPTFGTLIKLGYGNGFYGSGNSFNSVLALVEGRFALGPTVRLAFGYSRSFEDSILANYYNDDTIYARVGAQFAGRYQVHAQTELRFRSYVNVPTTFMGTIFCSDASCKSSDRSDLMGRISLTVDYPVNPWLTFSGMYSLLVDSTDFETKDSAMGVATKAGYTWSEFLLRGTVRL